jgi:high-affinity iron transporter
VIRIALVLAAVFVFACASGEDRGRRLYQERGCAVCHGASGRGDGPSARRLDAPPRDFASAAGYTHGASRNEIAASIRRGAGAMPPFRDISDAEAKEIAAWIVSLQRPSGGTP